MTTDDAGPFSTADSHVDQLRAFFDAYRAAWGRRDSGTFLPMYDRPVMALRLDGTLTCLHGEDEVGRFFGAALDRYVATRFETAELVVDSVVSLGREAALVTATWTLRRTPDVVLLTARFSYNVRVTAEGWKIYASTPHAE